MAELNSFLAQVVIQFVIEASAVTFAVIFVLALLIAVEKMLKG